jgi:hypothetical protein
MLTYDPIPWLMAQEGMPAVRARRLLNLNREGDEKVVRAIERRLAGNQLGDGSFEQSPMKTAGVLNLLDDLKPTRSEGLIEMGASYLLSVLRSQPGYEQAREVKPGNLQTPWDLCGFFGPYEDRNQPEVLTWGAREMNFYREYEPLLGPKSPVRGVRRSSRDRPGPGSCYAWGLIPLCYTVEALCRAGYAQDEQIQPAINALLGAQRESGGWCRNLGGHPSCTIHAVRALGSHPELRQSGYAERALRLMQAHWKKSNLFAFVQAIAAFDLPIARDIIHDALATLALRQRKNGTFGSPYMIERVAAVLVAKEAYES